jgi:hypothetical protein
VKDQRVARRELGASTSELREVGDGFARAGLWLTGVKIDGGAEPTHVAAHRDLQSTVRRSQIVEGAPNHRAARGRDWPVRLVLVPRELQVACSLRHERVLKKVQLVAQQRGEVAPKPRGHVQASLRGWMGVRIEPLFHERPEGRLRLTRRLVSVEQLLGGRGASRAECVERVPKPLDFVASQ